MSRKTSSVGDVQDAFKLISNFRDRWPRSKISLLLCHLFYAIDETQELTGELEDMKEAETMLLDLFKDLKSLVPEKREKPNLKRLEKELLKEEIEVDQDE